MESSTFNPWPGRIARFINAGIVAVFSWMTVRIATYTIVSGRCDTYAVTYDYQYVPCGSVYDGWWNTFPAHAED